jgi:hypothetical protein
MSPSQSQPHPSITDSPWFWLMLFSLAGLAALFTVGPKFEKREAGIEEKFHARERALGREAFDKLPDDATPPQTTPPQTTAPQTEPMPAWKPIFTLTPIALVLLAVAGVSMFNVMRFHTRRFHDLQKQ